MQPGCRSVRVDDAAGPGVARPCPATEGGPLYPLIRFAKEMIKFRGAPPLGPMDAHVSTHRCWPWDLDPWIELNNGRTLTLYDLGRIPLASRTGLVPVLREKGWSCQKLRIISMSLLA